MAHAEQANLTKLLSKYAAGPYADPTPEVYQQYGKELLSSGLYGLGLAGGGAALYHLLNGMGSAKVPELLRNPAPAVEGKIKKKKQTAARGSRAELKFAAQKSANSLMNSVYEGVGRLIPNQFLPSLPLQDPNAPASLGIAHSGWRQAANIAAAMGGGAAGLTLVNSMAAQKRKEDVEDEVEQARKAYFAALTGKEAAVLDRLHDELVKNAGGAGTSWLPSLSDAANATASAGQDAAEGAWTAALLTALGTGGIGAKYMYDQTKARTKAENLRRAQASRARLRGLQQTPYVDPEELAAIAGR